MQYGNLQRLYNIIYSPKLTTTAEILISLDAHKAFDRIEYEYLFKCEKNLVLGPPSVHG